MKDRMVVYVAGYGRSGSTLLERVLSSHEQVFGLGELASLLDLLDSEASFCSCGKRLRDCEIWGDSVRGLAEDLEKIAELKAVQRRTESLSGLLRHIFGHGTAREEAYRKFTQELFRGIYEKLPAEVSYVVDSSKTARKSFFRPIALSSVAGLNIKTIHLVRDGRGCMWSNLKGANRRMEMGLDPHVSLAAFRTAFSWLLANIAAHLFQLLHPKDYCRIRYEDFVEDPAATLIRLGEFLKVDFERQIEMLSNGEEIPLGHQIAGNRLRLQKRIVLKKDVEWETKLQLHHKLLFWLLDWPLALWYGYKWRIDA